MIATILPSSANFHAVEYNERKVAQGRAELLEMSNFGYLSNVGEYTWEDLTQYLLDYSSRNEHIKYPQFHLAVSCKGNEYSHEQLVEFAHRYLEEMGYGQPGQPLLIYAHHDTDNTHIHVITSRIDPDGKKINHKFEKVRSQLVVDQLMGVDEEQQVSETVSKAFQYRFSTVQQFLAILQSLGYETYMEDDEILLKRNGVVQEKVKVQQVEQLCAQGKKDMKHIYRLRAILRKFRDISSDRQELQDLMRKKNGVSLVFFGSKDSPYGYTIVDHHNKSVLKGSDVLKIKELLQFQSKEERFKQMDAFIRQILEYNADLTTRELNRMLRRQFGSRIIEGSVQFSGESVSLSDDIMQALRSNDRQAWLQSFSPSNETEIAILCKIGKYDQPERLSVCSEPKASLDSSIALMHHIFNTTPDKDLRDVIHENGFRFVKVDDQFYCIDFQNRTIFNMAEKGLDVRRLINARDVPSYRQNQHILPSGQGIIRGIGRIVNQHGGAKDSNREWEVGGYRYEVDDERTLKR